MLPLPSSLENRENRVGVSKDHGAVLETEIRSGVHFRGKK